MARRRTASKKENPRVPKRKSHKRGGIKLKKPAVIPKKQVNEKDKTVPVQSKPAVKSDVSEGKTLFVRNISFDATQEEFAEAFSKFGLLSYAVICMDKATEHSKGSGFVKFKNETSVEACLKEADNNGKGNGITLLGQILLVSPAMSREDIQHKAEQKRKQPKDNRNILLLRESFIKPGTEEANRMSPHDRALRTRIEAWNKSKLKNFNFFVSRTRLCVRNIPEDIDGKKLREIFIKAAGPGSKVFESRIMRDFKKVGPTGQGISKGYGFVNFSTHEEALRALHNTNNKPDIFTAARCPVVEFSLENRIAHQSKQKRLQRSRTKLGVTE